MGGRLRLPPSNIVIDGFARTNGTDMTSGSSSSDGVRRDSRPRLQIWPAIAAAVIGFMLSLIAWAEVSRWEDLLAEKDFAARANSHSTVLQNGLDRQIADLTALRALFQSMERGVNRDEFKAFSQFLLRDHPAILAVGWVPRITRDEREAHERAAAREGLTGYRIKSARPDGTLVPAPEADEYFPAFYSSREPLDSPVYGLDLNDNGVRQQALDRARDHDRLAASPEFVLHSGDGDRTGFFVVLPVFRQGLPHNTAEERRRNLVGFVQGVFQISIMIDSIVDAMSVPGPLNLYFFADDSGSDAAPVYFHPSHLLKEIPRPAPRRDLTASLHWSSALRVGDRQWTFVAAPIPGGPGETRHLGAWTVLFVGALITFIVASYFWAAARHAQRLQIANRQLDRANEQMGLQNLRFDTALNNMSQGLLMFDAQERVVVSNDRYIEMYELSRDVVKPGCSLIDLLRHRVQTGHFNRDPEQYRRELLAALKEGRIISSIVDTPKGRSISVINAPMAGGGWVATHEDITERRRAEAKVSYMAHHDALTGLPNRLQFHQHLREALKRAKRGEPLSVLCLDLDQFKGVNDTLGHPVGDLLLKAVAERLRRCIRDCDVVARLGGDEFAIVQSEAGGGDTAVLAARVIEAISAPYELDGHQILVGVSIGIAVAPSDGRDPDQLLKHADLALYRAKADGRGTYHFFEPEMDARMQARRALELDLRKAIAKGEFELVYQPLIDMRTNHVSGFEALLRWQHPLRGTIQPADFIPIAEETGLIVPIGEWVLRTACAEAATWPADVRIAVNLSPLQFKSKNLLPAVLSALATAGLSAARLELEITESVLLQDSETTLALLHRFRDLGIRISMDDFGTGYSSLSYLRKFPFDKIKIDQSFIRDMSGSDDSLAIVRAVVAMGNSLGMTTTAEGVETPGQLEQLKLEGCTEVQGYLFSAPRPAAEIRRLLAAFNPQEKAIA
jgi:diguanylate cyclase (GGDEF)-like protein